MTARSPKCHRHSGPRVHDVKPSLRNAQIAGITCSCAVGYAIVASGFVGTPVPSPVGPRWAVRVPVPSRNRTRRRSPVPLELRLAGKHGLEGGCSESARTTRPFPSFPSWLVARRDPQSLPSAPQRRQAKNYLVPQTGDIHFRASCGNLALSFYSRSDGRGSCPGGTAVRLRRTRFPAGGRADLPRRSGSVIVPTGEQVWILHTSLLVIDADDRRDGLPAHARWEVRRRVPADGRAPIAKGASPRLVLVHRAGVPFPGQASRLPPTPRRVYPRHCSPLTRHGRAAPRLLGAGEPWFWQGRRFGPATKLGQSLRRRA